MLVSSLIVIGLARWDEVVVKDLFNKRDCHLILQIPLSTAPSNDKWIWTHEPKGVYTVSSGYKVLSGSANQQHATVDIWSMIWKAKIPKKVQHFA